MKTNSETDLFCKRRNDDSIITGVRGGSTHYHEYNEGLGVGHIKIEKTREYFPVNNFKREVDNLLPNWMKDGDGGRIPKFRPIETSRIDRFAIEPLPERKHPWTLERSDKQPEFHLGKSSFDPPPVPTPVFEPIRPRFETPNFAAPRMTQAQFERYSPPPMLNEAQAAHYGPVDMMTQAQHQMYDAPSLMNEAQAALYGPSPIIKPGY